MIFIIAIDTRYNDILIWKVFFVAAGLDGIDVYKVTNGHITFLKTLDAASMNQTQINIVDIDASEDGEKLYVLDSIRGFTYINIVDINKPV